MILITGAIIAAVLFLSVEIPVFIARREEEDFLVIIASLFVLAFSIVVLYLK